MPEFEKTEFEFPDEKEAREAEVAQKEEAVEAKSDEPEIEIVDDTPDNLKDRKSTRLNSSHSQQSRMPSSA